MNAEIDVRDDDRKKDDLTRRDSGFSVSLRAVLISIVFIVAYTITNPLSQIYRMREELLTVNAPSGAIVGVLFLMFVWNPILKRVAPKRVISQREMVAIYGMVYMGGLIASWGFFGYFVFSIMTIPKYVHVAGYSTIRPWFEKLAGWAIPESRSTALGFWMGGQESVPWSDWIIPIIVWTVFIFVLSFIILCTITIVRRHWNEREHLRYPIVDVVLKMTEDVEAVGVPQIYRNKLTWLGMGFPVVFYGINILHAYFPVVPAISTLYPIYKIFSTQPLKTALSHYPTYPHLYFYPALTGIAFLLPLDLTFSIWFFYFLHLVRLVITTSLGGALYVEYSQTHGAYAGLALLALWFARENIKAVIRTAFGKGDPDAIQQSKEECLAYPVAIWGLLIAAVFFIVGAKFLLFAPVTASVSLLLSFIGCALAIARIRSEAGFPIDRYGGPMYEEYMGLLGSQPAAGTAFYFMRTMYPLQLGSFLTIGALFSEQYRMSEAAGLKRRHVTLSLLLALVVSSVAAFVFGLPVIYKLGGFNAASDLQTNAGFGGDVLANMHTLNFQSNLQPVKNYLIGVCIVLLLGYIRSKFVWWPFHPIGFAFSTSTLVFSWWGPIFVAWLLKFLVVRYAGQAQYRKLTPIAYGLIIGQVVVNLFEIAIKIIVTP